LANNQAMQKTETLINEKLEKQSFFQKDAQKTLKDRKKLRANIRENEFTLVKNENEMSTMKLEILNCGSHIAALKEEISYIMNGLDKKNVLIAQYEQEIRKNNDLLSKKAAEMDALNKRIDQMSGGTEVILYLRRILIWVHWRQQSTILLKRSN
jgi:chromosome segregation ATPase